MEKMRTYPSGVPCWIDTEQPDPDAARRFYGGLFGWTFHEAMPPGVPGSYVIAQLDGHDVGAIAPADSSTARWNTYVAVADADATITRTEALGGTTTMAPESPGPAGRSAAFVDPAGAELRLWQPGRRLGAQRVNEPGAWVFSDLHTDHPASVFTFYEQIFGWETSSVDTGGGAEATLWRRPGYGAHLAATVDPGIEARQDGMSAPAGYADAVAWLRPLEGDETPHWHVTFAVADRDAAVDTARSLGASDLSGPVDSRWTKVTRLRDPQGAVFSVSQLVVPG